MLKLSTEGNGFIVKGMLSEGKHPYDEITWKIYDAKIEGSGFEQKGVEFPDNWKMNAINIVSSKYFAGKLGTPEREYSLKQLIDRVADTITTWGIEANVFDDISAEIFNYELKYLMVHQMMAFNSPVWFNLGNKLVEKPQCSACFINSVKDDMKDILNLAVTEGMIFKDGSGSGINLSNLRGEGEPLSRGGTSSGPLSFMKGLDAFAGSIKSGGRTRRAAKMVTLDADHPDIVKFIMSKVEEEKKAHTLIDGGYDGSFNGEAYQSVFFQNANHSVRARDELMEAIKKDEMHHLRWRTDENHVIPIPARKLMDHISEATHFCGDPGMQFIDTINKMHTCKNDGDINASNPCSEYLFLDDTACNLASLNLVKFHDGKNLDIDRFRHAVRVTILAMELLVSNSSYPTEEITQNSEKYRTLGIGYTNLGAMLMRAGLAYDSDRARSLAKHITSLMTATAYSTSAEMACLLGPFERFEANREPMLEVIKTHMVSSFASGTIEKVDIFEAQRDEWENAFDLGQKYGFRNAQVSLLAPTGTISFMMSCDTTGIEPEIRLKAYKKLVGGGGVWIVNESVEPALRNLGYNDHEVKDILDYVETHNTVVGSIIDDKHLEVFDTSIVISGRMISYLGHLKMMGAIQPFLSGGISKTVNVPEEATSKDIADAYLTAWELGVKAVAIYRDNSKRLQPINADDTEVKVSGKVVVPQRRRLPATRQAINHKFEVDGHEGYINVGKYDDGSPGEVFIEMSKQGSTLGGVMDSFAVLISLDLQYGVPLAVMVKKFIHTKFEPRGYTGNPDIPIASSIIDYIFRWLGMTFIPKSDWSLVGIHDFSDNGGELVPAKKENSDDKNVHNICSECGGISIRSGSCFTCTECGMTTSCG